ncbi:MAG: hypothetical protein JWM06_762 [Actinomycetia bacterium]|jgi:hypothetical protein|nr:hypothetical protein [Actinomycetes bacterium]
MRFIATFLAVAALAVGGTSLAVAGGNAPKPAAKHAHVVKLAKVSKHQVRKAATETPGESPSSESSSAPESAADTAAQDAACKAAGVDPAGSNVNFDDATGTCSNNG